MGKTIGIYRITHKEIDPLYIPGYKTLLVGACKNNTFENDYIHDNIGENISEYNDSYCELTGLYWIWKNAQEDILGLVHYRRLFANIKPHFDFIGRHVVFTNKEPYSFITREDVMRKLKKADVIVKQSEFRMKSVEKIFIRQLGKEMFDQISESVRRNNPEYMSTYERFCRSHSHINCNMFIGKRDILINYCEWLFPILTMIDSMHIEQCGERYHNREIGYVSELLFGVWLKYNNIKYTTAPVVFTEDPTVVNGVIYFKNLFSFIANRAEKKMKKEK